MIVRALVLLWVAVLAAPADARHVTSAPAPSVEPEQAKRLIEGGEAPIFVDLRPADAYRKSRLPGARSVPLRDFERRYSEVPRKGRVILYCACPPEDLQAAYQILREEGYRNVSVMADGFAGWVQRGYPVER